MQFGKFDLRPFVILVVLVSRAHCVYVETNHGWVFGRVTPEAIVFLGIPFAQPPGRWEVAVPTSRWSGIWDARRVRPMCIQPPCNPTDPLGICLPQMSEDCLYLNVYMPQDATPFGNKAVIVFIHGGSFEAFTGSGDLFNGERFVSRGDVILVTINFRLGAFGFVATGSGPRRITGNFGIKDQRLALEWVNENIARFGGDPDRVTLMGHSAGAISVATHMLNGKATPLFRNAILISPPLSVPFRSFDQAIDMGSNFSANLNCSPQDIECLRSKSPMEILDAQQRTQTPGISFLQRYLPWLPHMDGDEVPINIITAIERGYFSRKPVIIGTTSSEGTSFSYNTFPSPLSRSAFAALLLMMQPKNSVELFRVYFPRNLTDARDDLGRLITDFVFTCPTRKIARDLSYNMPTWLYVFEQPLTFLNASSFTPLCVTKACHGGELPYLFQSVHRRGIALSPEEQQLSNELLYHVSNFANTNNPNGLMPNPGGQWPQYETDGQLKSAVKVFALPASRIETDYQGLLCGTFNQTAFRAA